MQLYQKAESKCEISDGQNIKQTKKILQQNIQKIKYSKNRKQQISNNFVINDRNKIK